MCVVRYQQRTAPFTKQGVLDVLECCLVEMYRYTGYVVIMRILALTATSNLASFLFLQRLRRFQSAPLALAVAAARFPQIQMRCQACQGGKLESESY